jgi:hypothetical protein
MRRLALASTPKADAGARAGARCLVSLIRHGAMLLREFTVFRGDLAHEMSPHGAGPGVRASKRASWGCRARTERTFLAPRVTRWDRPMVSPPRPRPRPTRPSVSQLPGFPDRGSPGAHPRGTPHWPTSRQSAGQPSMGTDGPRAMPGTRYKSWSWKWRRGTTSNHRHADFQ